MPWGVAAGAIGSSLISGIMGSNAAEDAANTQANASNNATAFQKYMYEQNVQRLQPWQNAGQNALNNLTGLVGSNGANGPLTTPFSAQQYQQSPGYQWQLGQGTQAIMNNASSLGGVNSGNTLKALMGYGQGLANQDYYQAQGAYQNWQNQVYNMNSGISNTGVNAAGQSAGLGANLGTQVGNNMMSAGAARAAGQVGSANALSGTVNNIGNYALLAQMQNQQNNYMPPIDAQYPNPTFGLG
jgi:hypothetical protein